MSVAANAHTAIGELSDRLLWDERPAWTLALVRILLGVTLLTWVVTLMLDASTFLADDGLVPPSLASGQGWRWFELDTTRSAWIALVVLAVAAIAMIIGWLPNYWAIVAFILLVAVQRRDPLIINSGDLILRNLTLLLVFCPSAAALSVDRWRHHGRAALWTAPSIAPWGLRLIQLQIVVVYFFAFWSKSGATWHNGTAVSTALRLDDLQRITMPWFMTDNVLVVAVLTWGALAVELSLALLLWSKPLRIVLIPLGILLHVFIDGAMLVGFFGPVMAVGLLSFVDADWLDRWVSRYRERRNEGRLDTHDDGPDLARAH